MYGNPQAQHCYGVDPAKPGSDVTQVVVFAHVSSEGTCTLGTVTTVRNRINQRLRGLEDESRNLRRQLRHLPDAVLNMPLDDFFNLNAHLGGPAL